MLQLGVLVADQHFHLVRDKNRDEKIVLIENHLKNDPITSFQQEETINRKKHKNNSMKH